MNKDERICLEKVVLLADSMEGANNKAELLYISINIQNGDSPGCSISTSC